MSGSVDAISAMEQLHPTQVIFPANLFRRARQAQLESTPPASNSRGVAILALIEWANTRASELGRAHEAIPPWPFYPSPSPRDRTRTRIPSFALH